MTNRLGYGVLASRLQIIASISDSHAPICSPATLAALAVRLTI
ncbi:MULTISPECIES: hypothetical protein [unclassified Pseudomonas]|nr:MULTISPECIES: hypothetical protein [unclassified Pseudomonas]